MKKITLFFLICALVYTALYPASRAFAASSDAINLVIVMDNSGSMRSGASGLPATDKNGIRFAASTMFVDRLPVAHARMGFIRFTGETQVAPLTDLSDDAARAALRDEIDDRTVAGDRYTKIDKALSEAAAMLDAQRQRDAAAGESGQYAIVLLTDGMNDYQDAGMHDAESLAANDETRRLAADVAAKGYDLFTVGLFPETQSARFEEFRGFITDVAQAGGHELILVSDTDDLVKKVDDILGELLSGLTSGTQVELGFSTPWPLVVPYDGLTEANVTVSFPASVKQDIRLVSLTSPSGEAIPVWENGAAAPGLDAARFRTGDNDTYINVKMLAPEKGQWTLYLGGSSDATVTCSFYISQYATLQLQHSGSARAGEEQTFIARYERQDAGQTAVVSDPAVYADVTDATLTMILPDGSRVHYPMTAAQDCLYALVTSNEYGDMRFFVRTESPYLATDNENDPLKITILPRRMSATLADAAYDDASGVLTASAAVEPATPGQSGRFVVTDADGAIIYAEPRADLAAISPFAWTASRPLFGEKAYSLAFVPDAADSFASDAFPFVVGPVPVWIPLSGALALAALIALAAFLLTRPKKMHGTLYFVYKSGGEDRRSGAIPLARFRQGVSLGKLLGDPALQTLRLFVKNDAMGAPEFRLKGKPCAYTRMGFGGDITEQSVKLMELAGPEGIELDLLIAA